jgi:alkanesulfonate monooxygenase SsuD/methylene tetrahydromethanopterin reductase-like flavin-dependent oxidoreductase (luciferase family)
MAFSVLRFDMRAPDFSPASARELYAAALDMATWADEKNFDALTLSEHHGVEDGYLPAPLPMAGLLAGRTRRIPISVVALLAPLYEPLKLAEDLAILDIGSGGRVSIVAGMGYRPEEYAMFGREFERRGKLLDEILEFLLRAWPGEPFEHRGETLRLTPKPITQPLPPVRVGGQSLAGARRAARLGLPFQPATNDPAVLRTYQEGCVRRGAAPVVIPPGSGEMIFVSEDPERTWSQIGRHLLYEAMSYSAWQPANQRSAVHSDATTVEALRKEGKYLVLTPEECVARAEAQGPLAAFVLYPLCGGTPPELAWQSLELYADRVLPHIA